MAGRIVLFGATGYTGELTARELAGRGERPILAARSEARGRALAEELGGPSWGAVGGGGGRGGRGARRAGLGRGRRRPTVERARPGGARRRAAVDRRAVRAL